jgi:hypothetical protein
VEGTLVRRQLMFTESIYAGCPEMAESAESIFGTNVPYCRAVPSTATALKGVQYFPLAKRSAKRS